MRFEAVRETSSLSLVDSRSNIMSISHGMCRTVEFLAFWCWKLERIREPSSCYKCRILPGKGLNSGQ